MPYDRLFQTSVAPTTTTKIVYSSIKIIVAYNVGTQRVFTEVKLKLCFYSTRFVVLDDWAKSKTKAM